MKSGRLFFLVARGLCLIAAVVALTAAAFLLSSCAGMHLTQAAPKKPDKTGLLPPEEVAGASLYQPDVLRLEAGQQIQTRDGIYTPKEKENWFPERLLGRFLLGQ